jgi:DNA adenine methylase
VLESPQPVLHYYGSKWQLAPWICANLPRHRCYVEAFAGSAAVLLRKPRVPVEYLNDRDGDLVCFFTCLRDRAQELGRYLAATPLAEALVEAPRPEDPLERAGWVFLRSWGRFVGGRTSTFALSAERSPALLYRRAIERLQAAAERLRGVTITGLDFRELFARLDRPGVCFYCDPPYLGEEASYPGGFAPGDHEALAEAVAGLRHACAAVSYADHPRLRELYPQAAVFRRRARSFAGAGARKRWRTELLLVTRPGRRVGREAA